ncbi:MAG: amidohydrolase family protein, partial [Anderseniella sp.]
MVNSMYSRHVGKHNTPQRFEMSQTMKSRIIPSILCSLAILLGASAASAQIADTVFTGGKVYTVDENQSWAEAVAVKDNKIVFVGSAADAKKHIGESTKVIDCAGKTVMPGFVSAHDHLIASNWTSDGVSLLDVKTKEECLKKIKEYADANPDLKVVKGIGWNAGNFGG